MYWALLNAGPWSQPWMWTLQLVIQAQANIPSCLVLTRCIYHTLERKERKVHYLLLPESHISDISTWWLNSKESTCQCRRCKRLRFSPSVGKIPCRRAWQPALVFLPGESHGRRSLEGYSPWSRQELDSDWATEHTVGPSAKVKFATMMHPSPELI